MVLALPTYRDVTLYVVSANSCPDHGTVATCRRKNREAVRRALAEVSLMAR